MNRSVERRGYALLWVIVLVAVLAALAASATPYLVDTDRRAVDSTAQMLREIGIGMNAMEAAVARKFPGRPSELTNAITGNVSITSCWGTPYNNTDATNGWPSAAPYVSFMIPTNGLWTPIGRLRDSVEDRTGATGGPLWLDIPGVGSELAKMLDLSVDGAINNALGTVRYAAPVNDTTTVRFGVTPRESRC